MKVCNFLNLSKVLLIGLFSSQAIAQTCPAGFSADTLDWSAEWDAAWNGTLGPHTMTTPDGVDITFSLSVSGAGCSAANLSFGDPFISSGLLRLAANWPNPNCTLSMQLDFSVGSPINVQEVQFSAQDVDGGGTASWHDEVIFNGASTITPGASITPVTDGGNANGPVFCSVADANCFVTGAWNSPISSLTFDYQNGPNAPADPGGQVIWLSDVDFCYPDTVPVTLGTFKSSKLGDRITAKWETVSESFNLGFTLWGQVQGEWVALHDDMIRSRGVDKATTSRYRIRLDVSDQNESIDVIGLSSVDTNGAEEFYGPFNVGESYGLDSITQPIKWSPIRDAYERKMAALGYQLIGSEWRKSDVLDKQTKNASAFVSVTDSGVYRLTYEEILAAGLNLNEVPLDEVALSFRGKPIPRDIRLTKNKRSGLFGPGAAIFFYGAAPTGEDAIYLDSLVYQVSRDANKVIQAGRVRDQSAPASERQTVQTTRVIIEENNFYDEIAAGEDPWMMAELFSFGSIAQQEYIFELADEPLGEQFSIQVVLNAVTDFEQIDIDGDGELDDEHRIQILVNDQLVADKTNDGTVAWIIDATAKDTILQQGMNRITIRSTGDTGYDFSLVNIDSVSVAYQENIVDHRVNESNALVFSGTPQQGGFTTKSDLRGRLYAYAYTDSGNFARTPVKRVTRRDENGFRQLSISGISQDDVLANYWISNADGFKQVGGVWLVEQGMPLSGERVDYVIVADPSLVGGDLDRFIAFRQESGYNVGVYTSDQIIDQFGYGMKTPDAFRNFLIAKQQESKFSHLLLVGGHTYDYLNQLNAEVAPVNFIPTYYQRTHNLINYSPTDFPYSDLNNSGSPDIAIGRWPVRNSEELTTIIDKTIRYESTGGATDLQSALLIAERNGDGLENFSAQLDRIAANIGQRTTEGGVAPWDRINKVYVDDVEAEGFAQGQIANTEVRERSIRLLNEGQSLTVFSGHGSPTRWSNQSLFTWRDVMNLDNDAHPTQIGTLACYTTYYQSPSTESLAHQFLFDSGGAVSINGASVLGSIRGNEVLLEGALVEMLQEGITMGEAVRRSKSEMLDKNIHLDTVITWTTLGDPAIVIRQ